MIDLLWLILDAIATIVWWVGVVVITLIVLFVVAVFGLILLYSFVEVGKGEDGEEGSTKH